MEERKHPAVGAEFFYTGRQSLEMNPYAGTSRPYALVGMLAERRFGRLRAFLNAENLMDSRQTRCEPLLPSSEGPDGRRTVDAWAPLYGRVFNCGVQLRF